MLIWQPHCDLYPPFPPSLYWPVYSHCLLTWTNYSDFPFITSNYCQQLFISADLTLLCCPDKQKEKLIIRIDYPYYMLLHVILYVLSSAQFYTWFTSNRKHKMLPFHNPPLFHFFLLTWQPWRPFLHVAGLLAPTPTLKKTGGQFNQAAAWTALVYIWPRLKPKGINAPVGLIQRLISGTFCEGNQKQVLTSSTRRLPRDTFTLLRDYG